MTAVIHHGPPGSYKSFSIVQNVVIPALQKGRTVITNIRGLDSIERIQTAMGIDIPESARLVCVKHDDEAGFQHMARFFQWAPFGALIVMDEGQRVYPTRLKNLTEFDTPADKREQMDNGIQRPTTVENAFDQHRHMNWDIYISTTNIGKIHKEVRAVAEYGYRHREMSGVVPWWKNSWREFKHDPESSGKSVSHYIGTPVRRKADTRVFECYRSTATGTAKGSSENKSVFADPKLRILLGFIALVLCWFFYNLFKVISHYSEVDQLPAPPASQVIAVTGGHVSDGGRNAHDAAPADRLEDPEQPATVDILGGRKVYYTGTFRVHHFNLVSENDYISITSDDLIAAGYEVNKVSPCLVLISTPKITRYALCQPEPIERPVKPVLAQVLPTD